MKIDIHTHILPKTWPDLHDRYGYGGWIRLDHHKPCCAKMMMDERFFREIESNCWDPGVRMSECDEHGVDIQVLSTVPVMFGYWARPEHAHDLSKLLNDHIAGICHKFPRRFVGLGTVPLQDTDRSVEELERCMRDLGLAGIEIGTHVNGRGLDDPSLFRRLPHTVVPCCGDINIIEEPAVCNCVVARILVIISPILYRK